MKKALISIAVSLALAGFSNAQETSTGGDEYLYAGSWTNLPSHGTHPEYARGIYGWRFSPATGQFTSLGLVARTDGPESLAVSPNGRFLYATQHDGCSCLPGVPFPGTPHAGVAAFAIDPATGSLKFLNSVDAQGDTPAHIQVDGTGSVLALGNYYGGDLVTYRILPDGRLSEAVGIDRHSGPSAHGGPHAHGVAFSPDNRLLYVADQGLDRVYSYKIDIQSATIAPLDPPYIEVKQGYGPRHLAVHPNGKWVYANNEQEGVEIAFESSGGKLKQIQEISVMPEGVTGRVGTAESKISPDGKFLYVNSRDQQGISVFAVDQNSGKLTRVEFADTSQKVAAEQAETHDLFDPTVASWDRADHGARMFAWDSTANWVASANIGEGAVVILRRDPGSGKLTQTGQVLDVPQPSFVVFAKPQQGGEK